MSSVRYPCSFSWGRYSRYSDSGYAAQPATTLKVAILLQRRLVLQLDRLRPHHLPADLQHHVPPAGDELCHLAIGEPAREGDRHDPEHGLRDFAHRAHHSGPDSGSETVGGA